MHQQIRVSIILILILLFSFLLRIYHLESNPPELFSDEITQVLSARSIIENGYDVNGKLNLFLYNKIKLGTPIFGYLSAFSTYILGVNAFAVRFPAAVFGVLSVYLIYLLCLHFTKDKVSSLVITFLASITPWAIYFSRIGWEPSMTTPFILASIYLFIRGVDENQKKLVIYAYILFALSVYASDAAEFLSPLFMMLLVLVNIKNVWKNFKTHLIGVIIFAVLMIPLIYVSFTNPLKHDRSIKISTFKDGVNSKSLQIFVSNYKAHFTNNFLFKNGDPNLRHGTGQDGVLYWTILPLVVIGSLTLILKMDKRSLIFLTWLLIFPLGGALTNDGVPHATRTLIGMPIFMLISAIGLNKILTFFKNRNTKFIIITIVLTASIFEFISFFKSYYIKYPINSQPWWEYGQREVFDTIIRVSNGDESLCLTNIEYWHEETLVKYYLGVNHRYNFIYDINDPKCLSKDIVVLPIGITPSNGYRLVKTTYSLEGNPIWNIYKSL